MQHARDIGHTRLFELLNEGKFEEIPQTTVSTKKHVHRLTPEDFENVRIRAAESLFARR
ncbi:MAG: hypothetical protein ABJQ34_10995 [Paracoccaceae bacterium]